MKNNKKLEFGGFTTSDGDFITYINNTQVDYCLLLKKIDPRYGDAVSNFEIVKHIFSVPTFGKSYGKDIITNIKYPYCRIVTDKNERFVYNKKPITGEEYILVSFREYYFRGIVNEFKGENNMLELYRVLNSRLLESMMDTLNKENEKINARTRK